MGTLVIAAPPDWKKQLGLLLGLLLLVGGVALAASWVGGRLTQSGDVWTADQAARAIEQGTVKRVILRGNQLTVETRAGARAIVRQDTEGSIIDRLRSLDVPAERLSRIEGVVEPAPVLPVWLSRWLWSIPIVILLLGIWGVVRFGWGRQLRTR